MILYSIFDKKVMQYAPPYPAQNLTSALRSLQLALKEPNNLSAYPHDFALYDVGEFNDKTGMIESINPNFVEEIANLVPQKGLQK